ncbi:MAG: hypothetical protein HY040_05285 [Planctomycetes bacterium]|nr:hypothetical protein [Planctomycetota bacterium]
MIATILKTPRAHSFFQPANRMPHTKAPQTKLVPREKVQAMLHEIAYVLHVTRKVKSEILEAAR